MKKRLLSILTALCLCLTLLPGTVLANEGSGAVLAEEGGEAETAVSPYSEVTITAHQPLKHAPVLGTLDASAVDETVTPRRGMFFYKGMSGVAEITDLTAYQAGEADSLRPIENQGEKYTPGKLYQLQLTFYTPLLLTGDVRFACNRRPVTVYDTPAEALQAMQAYDGKGDLCAAYIQRHENGMGDVEGDNYFLYLYWLLRIPDTVSTRAELIAALKDPAKTYIELSNGISLTTEDDVNHPVTYDITGGTINIHGNTIVTFAGKGTVYSKLSLWGGGATFSAPDAVINGDVDFGSYSGSLTGGTFNGDINCYYGTIKGGAFYGNITSSSGKTQITGGTFYGSVANCEIDESAKVSVTFDTGDSAVDTQRVLRGQKAEKPADPVKDGWRFTGWHSDGKEYDFTEPVTADTVLTANWMSTTTREVSTAEKLTAALSGTDGIVKLTDDITITEGLKIERDVTVDLNGHVLRYDEEAEPGSIFRVKSDCTLTLTDSRPEAEHEDESLPAGGLITGGKGYRHDGGSGGYHIYYYYGGGVYVEAGASFELAGGTIYACGVQSGANVAFGGGIYAEGGSVTMTGGAIRNCVLSANNGANGGGVYIYSGASFTMEGGVISGCSAMSGGGISASGGTVRITGGRIENCKASERGGGLSVKGHADQISVLDAAISGCEAKRGGGVALIGFAELELGENARITGCTATEKDDTEAGAIEYGAAVYTDLDSPLIVNYPGNFLYANGGRVEGTVYVGTNGYSQHVEFKATNAIDHTDGKPTTIFTGDVYCEGDIRGGSFYGSVTAAIPDNYLDWDIIKNFWSNISGGSFYKPVCTEGHVSGGTFYDGLTLEKNAKLSGKPVNTGTVINDKTNIPNPNGTPVTVTYEYGKLDGIYAKQIVQAGEKAIEPDVPSRQGYQFTDWYLDDTKYDFNADVTGDMTLTAKWTANSYTITFDTDGGSAIDPITQGYGTTIKAPTAPTKTGYTFAGWDRAIPATMPAENMTIKANWTVNQYTITFDTDGGSTVAPITQDYGTAITAPEAPTKIGYTFAGWNPEIPATVPADNLTITAQWRYNGGSSDGSSSYPITIPGKTENGSVTVSPKSASAGSTVTITVKPGSGYVLETISVTDKNGNDLKLTDKGNGKYTFTMPTSKVEIKVTFMEDNSVLNFFYDVPNDAYYYEAVKWAAENGITGGVGNSLFAPNQPCTRAQIVTFLWRAAGSPVVNYLMPFTDVDEGAYYAEAVRWAASTGIVTGLTETTFGTDSVCTRAQAAAMIYRCAQAQGKGFTGAWMFHLPFTDVPEWAYESVAWCYMNGVTTGVSETSFAPGNDCTRAQIVTFLWRAFSK